MATRRPQDSLLRTRNAELVARLADVDGAQRDAIVEELALANMVVARSVARRYSRQSELRSDLEQVALLALVRAAREFDVSLGNDFLAYAVPCMTGSVKRYFRDCAWMIRPPRDVQERHSRGEEGRSLGTLGDRTHVESCFRPRSLDAPQPGEVAPLGESLTDPTDQTWEHAEARLWLWRHLRTMSPRAQHILRRRFVEDRTQQEIADELGFSQYHVSRLLSRYVNELRERMTSAA